MGKRWGEEEEEEEEEMGGKMEEVEDKHVPRVSEGWRVSGGLLISAQAGASVAGQDN